VAVLHIALSSARGTLLPLVLSRLQYAQISRKSIEVLKEHFKDQMTKSDWKTVIKLKAVLGVD
jgi:hypothetical protein